LNTVVRIVLMRWRKPVSGPFASVGGHLPVDVCGERYVQRFKSLCTKGSGRQPFTAAPTKREKCWPFADDCSGSDSCHRPASWWGPAQATPVPTGWRLGDQPPAQENKTPVKDTPIGPSPLVAGLDEHRPVQPRRADGAAQG
jgi:hypothetical protein